jgi:hypothetical protein
MDEKVDLKIGTFKLNIALETLFYINQHGKMFCQIVFRLLHTS